LSFGDHPVAIIFDEVAMLLIESSDRPTERRATILDPKECSASAHVLSTSERWEIESTFDELTTHERGPKFILDSKFPTCLSGDFEPTLLPPRDWHPHVRSPFEGKRETDGISFTVALRITRRSRRDTGDSPPLDSP
jgi:hypothetical protein